MMNWLVQQIISTTKKRIREYTYCGKFKCVDASATDQPSMMHEVESLLQ